MPLVGIKAKALKIFIKDYSLLIKKNREWEINNNITPEETFINRRSILKNMGFTLLSSNIIMQNAFAVESQNYRYSLYPVNENKNFNEFF